MSGFLPDLAGWALGGGAGSASNRNEENEEAAAAAAETGDSSSNVPIAPALTEADMRARRLARMDAMTISSVSAAASASGQPGTELQILASPKPQSEESPMDVDEGEDVPKEDTSSPKNPPSAGVDNPQQKRVKSSPSTPVAMETDDIPKKKPAVTSAADRDRKIQRKKELMLKRVLSISLAGSCTAGDASCVNIDLDGTSISTSSVAEILATRLSLEASSPLLTTMPMQKPLIPYLAESHRKAGEELKNMRQSAGSSNNDAKSSTVSEMEPILEEIQRQVVSYSASMLIEPELFELAADGTEQLAKCLLKSGDPAQSIIFGASGFGSSFYNFLCEELLSQDEAAFNRIIESAAEFLTSKLSKCESVDGGVGETSALSLVSALTALGMHKKAGLALARLPKFLVPAAGTPQAVEVVRPPYPPGADIFRMLAGETRSYKRRSGPGLERETLLGTCMRVATPKNNPAFPPSSILRQSLDSVERTTNQQRQQLRVYQDALGQLVLTLIKAGTEARGKVIQWFMDCLSVNVGSSALRPDPSKVSSTSLMVNASVVLLRLCEPFISDEKKHRLIDPTFVSSPSAHKGIFATTGDDAVSRLGEGATAADSFNPKNTFIPTCFFLAARSLQLSIVPLLAYHENLLRHISHTHWELNSQNRDIQSDPHFCMLVSKQRSNEVALFQEEYVSDVMRFCNLMAHLLFDMSDEVLSGMPEHFVDNMCSILMSVAKMKPKLLSGHDFRFIFKLVVKLLSPKYASMVRNYNLRAMLGDILYELYLPSESAGRRDVPTSIACDPLAGGRTYLLSDESAQETLAPSLLLLYGEVEHTGYYDKMSHRAKISSLLKYLWESSEHRPAFRRITQNKTSFIKFANGIMNETNTLIATVMQKLPEIREAQEKMSNTETWGQVSEDEQNVITSRLEDNEREVKHALPLCNKTLQMFGYLNTDEDIRKLFLLDELCPRLVTMLLHVLTKLVGSKGLDLKVNNPEQYEFRPKEMLRDLCAIFALFASSDEFQVECAKSGCDPTLLHSAVKTCRRLTLLTGELMTAFESLPGLVEKSSLSVAEDEALLSDAPDEFLDEILTTFMKDPVRLPSGHFVDRSTITQHLLNDSTDPFNRKEMTVADIVPATELKEKMTKWVAEKRAAREAGA